MKTPEVGWIGFLFALTVWLAPARAAADGFAVTNAPGLALPLAHRLAGDELRRSAVAGGLVGAYVAFDDRVLDPYAVAACDDDGDPVVVLSDALLLLVDGFAAADATDAVFGGDRAGAYATWLAAEQRHGARLLPPPAGALDVAEANDPRRLELERARFRDVLRFVVLRELAHHALGHLVCPSPTATRERGDDVWTDDERARGLRLAPALATPARICAADARALASSGDSDTARRWQAFVARAARGIPLYAALHSDCRL